MLIDWLKVFQSIIYKKGNFDNEKEQVTVQIFLDAIKDLKYMGFFSDHRKSAFIFNKNYFGKVGRKPQDVGRGLLEEVGPPSVN